MLIYNFCFSICSQLSKMNVQCVRAAGEAAHRTFPGSVWATGTTIKTHRTGHVLHAKCTRRPRSQGTGKASLDVLDGWEQPVREQTKEREIS